MKKTCLFCVILVMIVLLSVPAFAAEESHQTEIIALCELPEISVVVPTTAEVFINPYQIPVTIESTTSTAQIVSTPACIENKSKVPMRVGVTVTGTVWENSSLLLSGLPTTGAGAIKRAFVYFEMQASDTATPPQSSWDAAYDAQKHLAVRDFELPERKMVTLSAAGGTKPFGAFRLSGDCSTAPIEAWTEEDGIDVKIVFTFTPLPTWTEIP